MRIGIFTTLFPYKKPFKGVSAGTENYIRGGVGEVVYNLSLKLAQLGHEIYVFTTFLCKKFNSMKWFPCI